MRTAPIAPPKREGILWGSVTVLVEHCSGARHLPHELRRAALSMGHAVGQQARLRARGAASPEQAAGCRGYMYKQAVEKWDLDSDSDESEDEDYAV